MKQYELEIIDKEVTDTTSRSYRFPVWYYGNTESEALKNFKSECTIPFPEWYCVGIKEVVRKKSFLERLFNCITK